MSKAKVKNVAIARNEKNLDVEEDKAKFSFSIPLKPQDKPVGLDKKMKSLIHKEYLNHYLETIGVAPTPQTLRLLAKKKPIDELRIVAAWKSQGWKEDTVQVQPILRSLTSDTWLTQKDDLLATTVRKEETLFRDMREKLNFKTKREDNLSAEEMEAAGDAERVKEDGKTASGGEGDGQARDEVGKDTPKTMCLVHFNKTHSFLRYARDRQSMQLLRVEQFSSSGLQAPAQAPGDIETKAIQELEALEESQGWDFGENLTQEDLQMIEEVRRPLSTNGPRLVALQKEFLDSFPIDRFYMYDNHPPRAAVVPLKGKRDLTKPLGFSRTASRTQKRGDSPTSSDRKAEIQSILKLSKTVEKPKKRVKSQLLDDAAKILTSHKMGQLIALLCHFLYWTLFQQYATEKLPDSAKEKIIVSVQKLHNELDFELRKKKHYSLFHLPLFLDSICTTCQNLFRYFYPKWCGSRQGPKTDRNIVNLVDKIFHFNNYLSQTSTGPHGDTPVISAFSRSLPRKPGTMQIDKAQLEAQSGHNANSIKNSSKNSKSKLTYDPYGTNAILTNVAGEKLMDLFTATSPMIRSIFPTSASMNAPCARSVLHASHHRSQVGPKTPRQRERSRLDKVPQPFRINSRTGAPIEPLKVDVENPEMDEDFLTRQSKTELFKVALKRVEDRHLRERTVHTFIPKRIGLTTLNSPSYHDKTHRTRFELPV